MGRLRYNNGSYFRYSESDAESFKPYFLRIVWIVFFTLVGVGIQNMIISGNAFDNSTSAPLTSICSSAATQNQCPKITKITLDTHHF